MDETEAPERPTTTDPDTETEELADMAARAEAGDEAAELALEEAGGMVGASGDEDEPRPEVLDAVEREAQPEPADDVVDVPTEEATVMDAEAEQALPDDIGEGEGEGPLSATGPDQYVAEAVEAPAAETEAPASEAEADVAETEAPAAEAPAPEEPAGPRSPFDPPGDW